MAALVPCMLLVLSVALVTAGPLKTRTVDQRQQGELNIHAQLENIVIVFIPSPNLNLLELATKTKFPGDKNSFLQLFQKPTKGEIDRYEVVNDIPSSSDELPVISSQQVILTQKGEKNDSEEEVVATVEEMNSATTPKAADEVKIEPTENTPVKEHSTIGETVQESVMTISVPEEIKNAVKSALEKSKETSHADEKPVDVSNEKNEAKKGVTEGHLKEDTQTTEEKEHSHPKKEIVSEKDRVFTEPDVKTVKELIRPVAAKDEVPEHSGARLVEGARREKVIKYKPETKWAPGLVDLLKPVAVRPKAKELEERQRFASLCAPGVWDTELQTCIMPGETRSRSELGRFLQAMRFGIALPSQ